ncbi:hypothetical protein DEO72_LG10g1511 [Vigna unguiculata]|uniref:Uncharacterized protein n=1 Tax=Vigna unguiculata TaxID=3917 RepID=A0A4D6N8W6_VIGUN|nr:hypothetical protein DEO72_LG10g1511 [Vigna unguiculata]
MYEYVVLCCVIVFLCRWRFLAIIDCLLMIEPCFGMVLMVCETKFGVERHVTSVRREWLAQASLRGNLARLLFESSFERGIGCLGKRVPRSSKKKCLEQYAYDCDVGLEGLVICDVLGLSHTRGNVNGLVHRSWTGIPSRYKDMGTDELLAVDKEVVEVLMKFSDNLPTKGLVRVYNSVHLIIDIEGHMTQSRKKNLALFQTLRKEMAAKAKVVGNTDVPNLQESLVEVHVHGGTKRKAELPARPSKGKDVKKVRAALLGAGSVSGMNVPESGLIELPEISVRKDIAINLPDTIINSIDVMEADHLVRTMVEFGSKALILSHRVGSLYRREVKEGGREKVEELQGKVDKFGGGRAAWKKERESLEEERKRPARLRQVIPLDVYVTGSGRLGLGRLGLGPVSYTHLGLNRLLPLAVCIAHMQVIPLDVYVTGSGRLGLGRLGLGPVSYTHLGLNRLLPLAVCIAHMQVIPLDVYVTGSGRLGLGKLFLLTFMLPVQAG